MHLATTVLAVGASIGGALVYAQSSLSTPSMFRATVELVTTDLTVVDKAGRSVTTLGRDDFILLQDGRPQALLDARYVRRAHEPSTSSSSRVLVLLIDDDQMRVDSALRLKEALARTLPTVWRAGDRALVLRTARDAPPSSALVSSLDAVLRQAQALNVLGPSVRAPLTSEDCGERLSQDPFAPGLSSGTFGPLERVLRGWPDFSQRAVVLVFADGVYDFRCPAARLSANERVRRLADLAGRRGAVVYGLQPSGLSSGVIMPETRGPGADQARGPVQHPVIDAGVSPWLKALTSRTGGMTVRANDIDAAIRDVLGGEDGYYLLTYEPPPGTFTTAGRPRYRRLEVRTTRRDLEVRGRSGFYSVPDALVP